MSEEQQPLKGDEQQCTVNFKNDTGMVLTRQSEDVRWGRFANNDDPLRTIPVGYEGPLFRAIGIAWTPSGTSGDVIYNIGDTGVTVTISWDVPWGIAFKPARVTVTVSDETQFECSGSKKKDWSPTIETTAIVYPAEGYVFKGGWYDCGGAGGYLHHTFVKVEYGSNKITWFDCYGGHTGENEHYEAEVKGNLPLAILIASGRPIEVFQDVYRCKPGQATPCSGIYNFANQLFMGDCSGILYAFTGVCHQIANRVMYATCKDKILWPPSAWLSFPAYGVYGSGNGSNSWVGWNFPTPFIDNVIESTGAAIRKCGTELQGDTGNAFLNKIHAYREENPDDPAKPEAEFVIMIDAKLPELAAEKKEALLGDQRDFLEKKLDYDDQLRHNALTMKEYQETLNSQYAATLVKFAGILGDDDFQTLFGVAPDEAKDYVLIEIETMEQVYKGHFK